MAKSVRDEDDIVTEDAPAVAAPAVAEAPAKKPHGQNPGDVVDQADAVGGRYENLGGGKYRRLADA